MAIIIFQYAAERHKRLHITTRANYLHDYVKGWGWCIVSSINCFCDIIFFGFGMAAEGVQKPSRKLLTALLDLNIDATIICKKLSFDMMKRDNNHLQFLPWNQFRHGWFSPSHTHLHGPAGWRRRDACRGTWDCLVRSTLFEQSIVSICPQLVKRLRPLTTNRTCTSD